MPNLFKHRKPTEDQGWKICAGCDWKGYPHFRAPNETYTVVEPES